MIVDYNAEPLVQVKDLCKYFHVGRHATLKAVDGVSFNIYRGETVGLVGESGCGKSTAGRCLIRLYEPTSGQVLYDGKDITKLSRQEQKEFCHKVQMIFQNPYASLNPRMTVKEIVGEGLKLQGKSNEEIEAKVEELLKTVGLNKDHMSRFPHEFSGGQRQRIGIARALSVDPEFIICDAPISALDVSIQAQVLNMLNELQDNLGLTYLFIAHDLSVVKYDKARANRRIPIKGEISSPINPKNCCRFASRCEFATERCFNEMPAAREMSPGHIVACHLMDDVK